jgi:secondary thiamine-phosphate synthase enzyme
MLRGTSTVNSRQQFELIDITAEIAAALREAAIADGICQIYNPHTTAGLTINEGADPAVRDDLIAALRRMVPDLPYRHQEGNSPAHMMTSLIGSSVTVFITDGRLLLGTWQRIFFAEFDGPRRRKIHWRFSSD